LLAEVERSNGGRGKTRSSLDLVYEENGIAKTTAQRWQVLATIPAADVLTAEARANDSGQELTSGQLYASRRVRREGWEVMRLD